MTACDIMVGKKDGRKMKMEMTMPRCFQTRTACEKKGPALYIDTYMKAGASV